MSESSPNKANGPSTARSTRQSRRLQGQTPAVEAAAETKSPRKTPTNARQRTQSQTSTGSTGSRGRRQRTTSFASSNGSRHADDSWEIMDGNDEHKGSPKQAGRKRRRSINFNDSNSSATNKTGSSKKEAEMDQNKNMDSDNELADQISADVRKTLNDSQKSESGQKKNDGERSGNRKQKGLLPRRAPESHAELFKQAVISKDFDKFSTVLRNMGNDVTSKKATIQDLDASLIIPTLKYINEVFRDDRLRERTTYLRDFRFTIDFMEMLLQVHAGYLSTLKNLDKLLGDLVEFAKARTANIDRLNKLDGQLSFVHDQMKMRLNPVNFGQQKEETYFEDGGRFMNKAKRQAAEVPDSQDPMDTS